MSVVVNVQEAKTRLSELLRRVEAGEDIVIARSGTALARLQLLEPRKRSFAQPLLAGVAPVNDEELLAPLSEDELSDWENGHTDDPLNDGTAP